MKKNLVLSALFIGLISIGFVSYAPVVNAACSYNGYLHSGGKCAVSFKKGGEFNQNYFNHDYLSRYIEQLLLMLSYYDEDYTDTSDVNVRTIAATNIESNRATLRATVDMDNKDEAQLYFEYGTSAWSLTKKTPTRDLDDSDDGKTQEEGVVGLNDDTRYYFRAVAVDEDGVKVYGVTLSFMTDDSGNEDDEVPIVTTRSATDVDDDSAVLRGAIDMNDFDNGVAFFVYGEARAQVVDVEDDFVSFDDVDEDGDDLRKVLVDSDVDGASSYSKTVTDLDENTEIYFTFCVEYEDEDDDETLVCGSVREFETD